LTADIKFCFRIASGGNAGDASGVSPISISMRYTSLLPVGRPLLWLLMKNSTK
jgi:hypothetical protein